ncbi:myosin light chain kinase, smooth muscle-like, partial [Leptonychotes weddellii]|uniref:Myosin light chain kinase, smooth muscle-like n=1 Tax=Leptonychotes weddellii TaxID=9713 RepID=A0A7F8Q6K6_LEPWE
VRGYPEPHVTWHRNGQPITSGGRFLLDCGVRGAFSLVIRAVCEEDKGKYTCEAANDSGARQVTVELTVEEQPIQYAHSSCEAGVAELHIQDALPEDDGTYTCLAKNTVGQASCSARVTVHEKKSDRKSGYPLPAAPSKPVAPLFLQGLSDLKVMDGSQVTMTVQVSGNPPPEVIWLHDGNEIQESEDFHFEQRGTRHSLCIQEVFPEDTGTYTCEAWNSAGEVRTHAVLMVQEPQDGTQPWFISKPRSVTTSLGQSVLMSCAIAGDPFPTVHWLRDGKALSKDAGHFEVLQNEDVFTLVLKDVQPWHAGQYEILLKNRVGECSCQVSLTLQSSPGRAPLR